MFRNRLNPSHNLHRPGVESHMDTLNFRRFMTLSMSALVMAGTFAVKAHAVQNRPHQDVDSSLGVMRGGASARDQGLGRPMMDGGMGRGRGRMMGGTGHMMGRGMGRMVGGMGRRMGNGMGRMRCGMEGASEQPSNVKRDKLQP